MKNKLKDFIDLRLPVEQKVKSFSFTPSIGIEKNKEKEKNIKQAVVFHEIKERVPLIVTCCVVSDSRSTDCCSPFAVIKRSK